MRIGVYVCCCGSRVAGSIDVDAVVAAASTLPHVVVARGHDHLCSDRGKRILRADVEEQRLGAIVVASCAPVLREHPFREIAGPTAANDVALHLVNLRGHNRSKHETPAVATERAVAAVRAAVERADGLVTPQPARPPVHPDVLVVGGGIAGIEAALTIADGGRRVYLVERQPAIGGHMAAIETMFPALDCATCVLTPKMSAVLAHPNITLWTCSEVTEIRADAGNYRVQVTRHPRYVNEDRCTGCLECVEACVYADARFPDEFSLGLGLRKPVYLPFLNAVPSVAAIDPDSCLAFSHACERPCVAACGERAAIDLAQHERVQSVLVGSIIVATGFRPFDVSRTPWYGYGVHPNVYTSLEVEHMLNACGPTGGALSLRDGRTPHSIAIVHCVGSRDAANNRWCSRVCCMTSLKLAHLLRARTGAEVFNFYIDVRTPGATFEAFYQARLDEGVHFIRGRVAEVTNWALDPSEEGKLVIRVEDTLLATVRRVAVDMVVLSVGLEPHADAPMVARLFDLACSPDGFFLEPRPKLAAVDDRAAEGVFVAGCCESPKDLHDTIAQAGAAAAAALARIDGQGD